MTTTTSSTSVTRCPSTETSVSGPSDEPLDPRRAEAGHGGDRSVGHDLLGAGAEGAALLELVVVAAAEGGLGVVAADQPADAGPGVRLGQLRQTDQGVLSRGATAGDDDVLAGVPLGRLADAPGRGCRRRCGRRARPRPGRRTRRRPAGWVCPTCRRRRSRRSRSAPRGGPSVSTWTLNGTSCPAEGDQAVTPGAGDADDAVAVADLDARLRRRAASASGARYCSTHSCPVGYAVGSGPSTRARPAASRRPGRRARTTARRAARAPTRGRPLRALTGLQHDSGQSAGPGLGGRGQADGAGSDDDEWVAHADSPD